MNQRLKVIKARHSGFCFGVKRAISIAEDFLKKHKKACSLGQIIHNPSVVKELSDKGLKVISGIGEARGGYILIRSHGISPRLREKAKKLSIGMVDATCPFVKRSQTIITGLKKEGYKLIIAGEKDHPEVKALSEIAGKSCSVVANGSDISGKDFSSKRIALVAQTTLSGDDFLKTAASLLRSGCFECRIFNTICNDVMARQEEAKILAAKADIIIVVGGRNSANTRHLAKISKDAGARTYQIEGAGELKAPWFRSARVAGVISGASTPAKIVNEVVSKVKRIKNNSVRKGKW